MQILKKLQMNSAQTFCILALVFLCLHQMNSQCIVSDAPKLNLDQGTAVVCIHVKVNNQINATYAFKLKVDFFQALVVNKLAAQFNQQIAKNTTQNITVLIQFQNTQFSGQNNKVKQIQIYNRPAKRYRDVLSFILIIREGDFDRIQVDNAKCDNLVGSDICQKEEVFSKTGANQQFGSNDPKFFVSWMGTDVIKNHCISHTKRLSRFSSFSVGSIYNSAKTAIDA